MFCFGIYNQFNDDIKDIFDDIEEDNLTPYTYFLTHAKSNDGIENPYHYYWAVVYYLIYEVYQGNQQVKHLFIERCINAHKSLKRLVGKSTYSDLQQQMLSGISQTCTESSNDTFITVMIILLILPTISLVTS